MAFKKIGDWRWWAAAILAVITLLTESGGPISFAASERPLAQMGRTSEPQQALSPMALGLRFGPLLPELLGINRPATYLLLVQNNDELRATGGFISAVGTLTLKDARIVELEFTDSTLFFRKDLSYPPAPPAMQRYMNIPLLLLRDANWSPDLPTTAKLVETIYRRESGRQVDGIVTLDLRAVELLITALEPLTIEGADVEVTGATVVEQLKALYSAPVGMAEGASSENFGAWWKARKEFMPALAQSARTRLESGQVDLVKLLVVAQRALSERAIQVWLNNPQAQTHFADLGWDGGLHPMPGVDYVALVDTNMGYNKVDSVIERAIDYRVEWPANGAEGALATTTITYTHPVSVTDELCEPQPRYGDNYEDMVERCYFDYVRLYAPGGSKLVEMSGVAPDSVRSQRGEAGTQLFAGYFVLEPGKQHVVTITYRLPPTLTVDNYQLVVQRQSGTRGLPISLTIGDQAWSTTLTEGSLVLPYNRQ
jgi:hypothetical protein